MSKTQELTRQQLYELKWFCRNVAGVRTDYYKVMDEANKFDERLKRLEKTCSALEKYFGEKLDAHPLADWGAEFRKGIR